MTIREPPQKINDIFMIVNPDRIDIDQTQNDNQANPPTNSVNNRPIDIDDNDHTDDITINSNALINKPIANYAVNYGQNQTIIS
ncbi:hypothetical protein JTB14_012385 [Gonioctena quinquepunctata]|nr:hypothetical protein JTB14_012385 [Gonioctena quinquepunctata]